MTPSLPSHQLEASLQAEGARTKRDEDPLTGPVSAGVAVIPARPAGDWIGLIDDSKKLSERMRQTAMDFKDLNRFGFDDYLTDFKAALDGLSAEERRVQPAPDSHNIDFAIWHMARVEADLAKTPHDRRPGSTISQMFSIDEGQHVGSYIRGIQRGLGG